MNRNGSIERRITAVLIALVVSAGLLPPQRAIPQKMSSPDTASGGAGHPSKYAVLVGINNYKYSDRISPLAGSLNDVEEMRQLLIGKFEFLPENILVLKEAEATHAAIIAAVRTHLIARANAGDIVVFHYSGHGSQMKDVTGKMISGLDETIVPYDSRDPEGKVFDISGAELHSLLVELAGKTKNVTFILDSCHSGTLVRGARVRSIPADTRTPPAQIASPSATRSVASAPAADEPKFAFISAATSKESAFEHFSDNKDSGALTHFLAQQLRSSSAGATYRDVMDAVMGNVTANYPAQHPSLEGVEADQHVFGDASSLTRSYVTASPSMLSAGRVTLGVGQIEGATVGSIYEVFPPGSRRFAPPDKPVSRVQLVSVGPLASEATTISGSKIAQASRAVEREHRYGTSRVRVFLDGVDNSPALQLIRDALQDVKYIELVDRPTICNIQIRQVGPMLQTLAADSTTLSPPVSVNDPSMVNRVTGQLNSWAKWLKVLAIHNPQSQIDFDYTLKGSQTRDPIARIGRPDMGVSEGEVVDVSLTNKSDRDLYIAILDLSSDGSIAVVYPSQQGAAEVLKPGLTLTRSFRTSVPKGRSTVTDVLKAFVSFKPIDLTPITQTAIRGAGDASGELDPLQELLIDSSGVSRGLTPLLANPVSLAPWATAQRVLVIKRAH
jgi:hypothetical protein